MSHVDGFVLPVPKKNLPAYRRMAPMAGKIWREHGAFDYQECAGDDLDVKMGVNRATTNTYHQNHVMRSRLQKPLTFPDAFTILRPQHHLQP